jgi:hypothetical protein
VSCCDRPGESCYSDSAFGRAPCLGRILGFFYSIILRRLCGCSFSWLQGGCDVKAPVSMVNYSCLGAFA